MKKLLILLFSILISFNSYGGLFDKTICVETDSQLRDGLIYLPNKTKPFSGKNLCKYENGQSKSKGKIKDGRKNDVWTEWEENGQIKLERTYNFDQIFREKNYQNGIEVNDTSFSFNEKGLLEIKSHYKEGNLIGETKFLYNENDQIEEESNFIDGNLSSYTENTYYLNGQIYKEANYKDNKLDGNQTNWKENGQIISQRNYKNGKLVSKVFKYYENGQKKEERNYKDGRVEMESGWYENGQKKFVINYKDSKRMGTTTKWYEDGQKEIEANYKDGEPNGEFRGWFENGQIKGVENYENGKLEGQMTRWYKNGQLYKVKNYKDGIILKSLVVSTHKMKINMMLPLTYTEYELWEDKSTLPSEEMFAAMINDLRNMHDVRLKARTGSKMGNQYNGWNSLFVKTVRASHKKNNMKFVWDGPYKEKMIKLDKRWSRVTFWQSLGEMKDLEI
jgi:antitoxin component YwqK of YwqJK toxin-antitoxin module